MTEEELPLRDDDPSLSPRDNEEDSSGEDPYASIDPWTMMGFPSLETLRISRELAKKHPLPFRDQPGYPLASRFVDICMDPDSQERASHAFRKRLTERITKLLPVGFSGPSRKIGEHDLEWENDDYLVTLWQMDDYWRTSLTVYTKYREGIEKIDAVSRRLFNSLMTEYTLITGEIHGQPVPYIRKDPE